MKEHLLQFLDNSSEGIIKITVTFVVLVLTYIAIRLYRRYITATAARHCFAPQRTSSITKVGLALIYLVSIAVVSNVLGFGIQGIFVATSSFFALVGIAFFANWSILSNITASVILYFTFPYRIGNRIQIENEPKYSGILHDVTIMYLKIRTDGGSYITLPSNVAIQKIMTVQSEADYQKAQREAQKEEADV